MGDDIATEEKERTLYIFIDESGNFDFTASGTKFFTLTAVSTLSPLESRDELLRKMYEMSLKQYLKQNFKKPFYVYFHPTASDINCQIADYCGWAAYVLAERGEARPWEEIKDKVKSCFDVFAKGTRIFYEYKK